MLKMRGVVLIKNNNLKAKYKYRVTVDKIDNREIYRYVSGNTDIECEIKIENARDKYNREKRIGASPIADAKNVSLVKLCELHIAEKAKNAKLNIVRGDRGGYEDTTEIKERGLLYNHVKCYFMTRRALDIRSHDIDQFIDYELARRNTRGELYTKETIRQAYITIDSAYKWAIQKGVPYDNPCLPNKEKHLKRLRTDKVKADEQDVEIFTEQERQNIIEEVKKRTAACYRGWYYRVGLPMLIQDGVGMRIGELVALTFGDIDFSKCNNEKYMRLNKHITELKTEKLGLKQDPGRINQIHEEVYGFINEICYNRYGVGVFDLNEEQKKERIVVTRDGADTDPRNLERNYAKFFRELKQRGLICDTTKATSHTFRKTFATRKIKSGWSISDAAAYIGDNPQTVEKWYHSKREKIEFHDGIKSVVKLPKKT